MCYSYLQRKVPYLNATQHIPFLLINSASSSIFLLRLALFAGVADNTLCVVLAPEYKYK